MKGQAVALFASVSSEGSDQTAEAALVPPMGVQSSVQAVVLSEPVEYLPAAQSVQYFLGAVVAA